MGIKVDNHGYKNQILSNGYINAGIKQSNKLLLFITMVLKKLGKIKYWPQTTRSLLVLS
jgi:hypothetical protein